MIVLKIFDRLRTDLKLSNETQFYAGAVENLITLNYADKKHKINSTYSDWIATNSSDLLMLYEPPSGKDTQKVAFLN